MSVEWDGSFTPEQQAFFDEVEANTEALLEALERRTLADDVAAGRYDTPHP